MRGLKEKENLSHFATSIHAEWHSFGVYHDGDYSVEGHRGDLLHFRLVNVFPIGRRCMASEVEETPWNDIGGVVVLPEAVQVNLPGNINGLV